MYEVVVMEQHNCILQQTFDVNKSSWDPFCNTD